MAFFDKIKKKLPFLQDNGGGVLSNGGHKKKKHPSILITDRDPNQVWEKISEIGDGAFGKVYKARNRQTGIYAAAKIVEKCTDEDLDDYMVEIEILSECKHKNIVEIYEAYYYDQQLWMLIEFCSGGAVDTLMFEIDKPLSEPQIQYVVRETLEALVYLHENCFVIHRDMKAGNILLTESGQVKLADFGVSAKNMSPIQRRYTFIGTPYWMSPEVISCETDKEVSYDSKADIWSLGITCIELAEKEPPHNELNPSRVMMKIRKADPPRLREPHKWSKNFNDFLFKCLDKVPEQRLTARDLLKHPFVASFTGDERTLTILLGEKNATVNVVEEIEQDESGTTTTAIQNIPAGSTGGGVGGQDNNSDGDVSFDANTNSSSGNVNNNNTTTTNNNDSSLPRSKTNNSINNDDLIKHQQQQQQQQQSMESIISNGKPIAPLPPTSSIIVAATSINSTSSGFNDLDRLCELIFEDICDEVIKCDDRAPSVPDVILQVISEILTEPQQSSSSSNPVAVESAAEGSSSFEDLVNYRQNGTPTVVAMATSNYAKAAAVAADSSPSPSSANNHQVQDNSNNQTSRITSALAAASLNNNNNTPNNSSKPPASIASVVVAAAPSSSTPPKKEQPQQLTSEQLQQQRLNRNRTRKTITKTFIVDGQTVTQTIKKTVNPEEEERQRQLIEDRKRDLIEHRRNLNEDRRKLIEQTRKQENEKESLEHDFREQKEKLLREFEIKLSQIYQYRKAEIERCEEAQALELKSTLKRLKLDQEKSLKFYREQLKEEFKLFKRELESNSNHMLMSKEHREAIKKQKEKELLKREEEYQQNQMSELAEEEKRILKLHRQQLAHLETTSLLEKQNLIRTREAAIWELERLQMEQRCNVIRKHVRDFFYLQRHLMLSKQEKDLEHLRQLNTKLEEDLIRRQNEEKRLFLKSLRQEQRSRREMYRRSLYIIPTSSGNNPTPSAIENFKISPDEEKRKIKEFEEREKERFDNEIQRLNIRHLKQLEEYRIKADNIMKDLDDEQRLKRKQLVDAETKCLREVDDRYNQEYAIWQNKLRSRKQKLEDDFKREDAERSQFYQNFQNSNNHGNGHNGNHQHHPSGPYGTYGKQSSTNSPTIGSPNLNGSSSNKNNNNNNSSINSNGQQSNPNFYLVHQPSPYYIQQQPHIQQQHHLHSSPPSSGTSTSSSNSATYAQQQQQQIYYMTQSAAAAVQGGSGGTGYHHQSPNVAAVVVAAAAQAAAVTNTPTLSMNSATAGDNNYYHHHNHHNHYGSTSMNSSRGENAF